MNKLLQTLPSLTEWTEWIEKLLAALVSLQVVGIAYHIDDYCPTGGLLPFIEGVTNRAPNLEYMVIFDDDDYYWKQVRGEWALCDESEVP